MLSLHNDFEFADDPFATLVPLAIVVHDLTLLERDYRRIVRSDGCRLTRDSPQLIISTILE
jgi:hypothetical protein